MVMVSAAGRKPTSDGGRVRPDGSLTAIERRALIIEGSSGVLAWDDTRGVVIFNPGVGARAGYVGTPAISGFNPETYIQVSGTRRPETPDKFH